MLSHVLKTSPLHPKFAQRDLTEVNATRRCMQKLAEGGVLTTDEADAAITQIIDAQASEVEIAGFLGLVAALGETADLLAGAVRAVRRRMTALELAPKLRPVLDTCGTGGDNSDGGAAGDGGKGDGGSRGGEGLDDGGYGKGLYGGG